MASADLELCYLTATEAIDQFKAKKLSPVELMKAVLARCEAVNPKLNVLTYTFAERALEHAKASEARYMKGEARPLEGVPLAIKDFHPVKGAAVNLGVDLREWMSPLGDPCITSSIRLRPIRSISHGRALARFRS